MDDSTKIYTKYNNGSTDVRDYTIEPNEISKTFRNKAQVVSFEKLQEVMIQNVTKTPTRTFTKYTKELVQQYLQAPLSNLANLCDVSQFLWRVSPSYKKIIEYTALMPLFLYNVTYISDWAKAVDKKKFLKRYQSLLGRLDKWNMKEIFSSSMSMALRDGMSVGFLYDNENDGVFMHYLNIKYCKISGTSFDGNYIVKFNAAYFDSGNNKEFIYGINNSGEGIWDEIFVQGYEDYKNKGRDFQWFVLPIDRTLCLISGDEPDMPLPYYVTIFTDLLDIIDYQSIVRSKTELQNFVLLYTKIPLISNTEDVNDFALDIEMVNNFQNLINGVVPDLVGTAYGAGEVIPITFKGVNDTSDTDIVADSIYNLLSKVGISEMLFNSEKGGSVGLDASIKTDESFAFRYVNRIENWMRTYIRNNISNEFLFEFHPISRYSQKSYVDMLKEEVALGHPRQLDWATANGTSPYSILNKTYMENALDLTSLWVAPQSSWTATKSTSPGAPVKDNADIASNETVATRDGAKNA